MVVVELLPLLLKDAAKGKSFIKLLTLFQTSAIISHYSVSNQEITLRLSFNIKDF
jgi:uncharacterized membrane protein (GlpM family)